LKEIFAGWLSRRAEIAEIGISTPRLYGASAATLIEEYVPYRLGEALKLSSDRADLLRAIGQAAARLVNAGFFVMSAQDWRSRGRDVVLVDFGQDLGSSGSTRGTESGLLSEILDNLLHEGVHLSPDELRFIGTVYEGSLSL
jgi:hypothetical protein